MSERKVYLGDSVYADLVRGMIMLTTENGMGPSNTILLDHEVVKALEVYVAWLRKKGDL